MKTGKIKAMLWNLAVDAVVLCLPLIVQHKDKIIKHAKKVRMTTA